MNLALCALRELTHLLKKYSERRVRFRDDTGQLPKQGGRLSAIEDEIACRVQEAQERRFAGGLALSEARQQHARIRRASENSALFILEIDVDAHDEVECGLTVELSGAHAGV